MSRIVYSAEMSKGSKRLSTVDILSLIEKQYKEKEEKQRSFEFTIHKAKRKNNDE